MEITQTRLDWIDSEVDPYNKLEKAVILHCSDKLWEYLQGLKNKKLEEFDFITLLKIYKELKSLDLNLEKEKKDAKV